MSPQTFAHMSDTQSVGNRMGTHGPAAVRISHPHTANSSFSALWPIRAPRVRSQAPSKYASPHEERRLQGRGRDRRDRRAHETGHQNAAARANVDGGWRHHRNLVVAYRFVIRVGRFRLGRVTVSRRQGRHAVGASSAASTPAPAPTPTTSSPGRRRTCYSEA